MPLPMELELLLEKEISNIPIQKLQQAYEKLSQNYRLNRQDIHLALNEEEQRISYLAARMPSTYETVFKVLSEIYNYNSIQIHSVLDIGAGPGTASWACCEMFDSIQDVTLIEYNLEMVLLGKKLSQNHPILKKANWITKDITENNLKINSADLVIASYSFNEINDKNKENILKLLYEKTNKYLVIIDPGTPDSFKSIHFARKWFIDNHINLLAPCPHANSCPAYASEDWCHFYTRVQRTQLHKFLKNAEKGYEDEKFSYIIASKEPISSYDSRIIRHPEIHSGHLKINLCTPKGYETVTYSKKNGSKYKKARKSSWGDRWEILDNQEN